MIKPPVIAEIKGAAEEGRIPNPTYMVATQFHKRQFRTFQDFSGHFRDLCRTSERQKQGHFRTIFNIMVNLSGHKSKNFRLFIESGKKIF